jgi:predicted GNAT family N-acyltransferase
MGRLVPVAPEETHALRHRILRPNQTLADCAYPSDHAPGSLHMGFYAGDQLVGVGSIFREDQEGRTDRPAWRVRGMAVAEAVRGQGAGARILQALIAHAAGLDVPGEVWCNGRANVEGFYTRFGFERLGDVFDVPPIGPHVLMVKQLAETDRRSGAGLPPGCGLGAAELQPGCGRAEVELSPG